MKMEIVNIIAVLLSPIFAVLITIWIQNRKEKLNPKLWVFGTLMSTRQAPVADEPVKALNMIDVVFSDCVAAGLKLPSFRRFEAPHPDIPDALVRALGTCEQKMAASAGPTDLLSLGLG